MNKTGSHFVVIGGHKCASTWMYDMLCQHPSISLPYKKEVHYFSLHYNQGVNWYESHWKNEGQLYGDVSPSYYLSRTYLTRILRYDPSCKFILIKRDPYERARSHLLHILRNSTNKNVEDIINDRPEIFENSDYSVAESFLNSLPKKQFTIIDFSDIQQDGAGVLRELESFLGLENYHYEHSDNKSGAGFSPRIIILERLRNLLFTVTYDYPFIHKALRTSRLLKFIKRLNSKSEAKIAIDLTDFDKRF